MTDLNHTVSLTTGDWSHDGHGICNSHIFVSNFSASDIGRFMDAACKLHNLDFDSQCEEYEDSALSDEFIEQALVSFTGQPDALSLISRARDAEYIDDQEFAQLYLFIARLVEPKLRWEKSSGINIEIGGYGLYSN